MPAFGCLLSIKNISFSLLMQDTMENRQVQPNPSTAAMQQAIQAEAVIPQQRMADKTASTAHAAFGQAEPAAHAPPDAAAGTGGSNGGSSSSRSAAAAPEVAGLQQQLLHEGQERQRAQQLAAQLQQQVQVLVQQQVEASRAFQDQLQLSRDAAAAELQAAQQVSWEPSLPA